MVLREGNLQIKTQTPIVWFHHQFLKDQQKGLSIIDLQLSCSVIGLYNVQCLGILWKKTLHVLGLLFRKEVI